ncbi:MAG: hypothetical protein HY907_16650 [Deltaproteobacteria bacterium]|nr:hypothetical protein [Deltaproteobacteria bacterium]
MRAARDRTNAEAVGEHGLPVDLEQQILPADGADGAQRGEPVEFPPRGQLVESGDILGPPGSTSTLASAVAVSAKPGDTVACGPWRRSVSGPIAN